MRHIPKWVKNIAVTRKLPPRSDVVLCGSGYDVVYADTADILVDCTQVSTVTMKAWLPRTYSPKCLKVWNPRKSISTILHNRAPMRAEDSLLHSLRCMP